MLVRYGWLPVVAVVFLAVGLLMGAALTPVMAQQMSGVDGQVAVRSDGAVYLITGGQRRWVATVMITDAEINAYPEAEPIYTGLAPLPGSAPAPAPAPAASPAPAAPASPPAPAPASAATPATTVPASAPAAAPPPASAPTVAADGSIPAEIDIDGSPKIEAGDVIKAAVKTSVGATCDLTARFPDGSEAPQPGTAADARGQCRFSIDIPATSPVGAGQLRATVRLNGRTSQAEATFEVVPNS